jgi:hypothetical protein
VIGPLLAVAFAVILVASLFVKRHGESASPQTSWSATEERFRDPSTGRLMRVWLDPTGTRHYVPE